MIHNFFKRAAIIAQKSDNNVRHFRLGAVGIREDGAVVAAANLPVQHGTHFDAFQKIPNSHAEGRVLRKLGKNGTIFVARVLKTSGDFAMAFPCKTCATRIKALKVEKVYYSIDKLTYGIWHVKKNYIKLCNF